MVNQSDQERKAIEELISGDFIYHRVGYDCRPMSFLPDKTVGRGAAAFEIFWNITEQFGALFLDICDKYGKLTCRLEKCESGRWIGRWTRMAKMPVEVYPIIAKHTRRESRIINSAIMTIARPVVYIHDLLATLRPDMQIRLVVGGMDCNYLERYQGNPLIEIIEAPRKEYADFECRPLHHRASWNYWRTLTLGAATLGRAGLLVLEDDVILARGWEGRLHSVIDQIEAGYVGRYVLTLYAEFPSVPKSHTADIYYVTHSRNGFYGTQAIYFPESVRTHFADYLKKRGVESYEIPYDWLLGEYLKRNSIYLFLTIPCLAQHIGVVSTGLAGWSHQTAYFQADVSR